VERKNPVKLPAALAETIKMLRLPHLKRMPVANITPAGNVRAAKTPADATALAARYPADKGLF
jgi:hypothetical protein